MGKNHSKINQDQVYSRKGPHQREDHESIVGNDFGEFSGIVDVLVFAAENGNGNHQITKVKNRGIKRRKVGMTV